MSPLVFVLVGLVVFITHALEAVTGFGCTVLALPFVTALVGVKTGVPILATLAWLLALYIVITKWKDINFREFGIIVLSVGLGLPVGMIAFKRLDPLILKKALALFITLSASWQVYRRFAFHRPTGIVFAAPEHSSAASKTEVPISLVGEPVIEAAIAKAEAEQPLSAQNPPITAANHPSNSPNCPAALPGALPAGLQGRLPYILLLILGGIVHGAFASGGPLVVLYAAKALPDKGSFRATLCLLWTSLNSVLLWNYMLSKTFTPMIIEGTLGMIPFLVAGIIAGEYIHNRVNSELFGKFVFIALLCTGLFMLFL
ncbi:MAG: TSUP family transporter [Termitinemataceae bacterium]